jgi:Entner-Doudoroff aldolase
MTSATADFVELMRRERACAILRTDDAFAAPPAMDAAIAGGFRIVEVTLTTPGALELVAALSRRGDVTVGAGTVLTVADAEAAVAAGARFVVSPVTDPEVIRRAAALGVASLPGCHTPTEMLAAHRAGAPLLKLFPSPAGGPAWLRSVLAPLPFLRVVPTNGVDAENAGAWLEAGAWALGFNVAIFHAQDLRERRFDRIEERARQLLAKVRPAGSAVAAAPR